ncbi:MAG: hypothetical protein HONBIEJF_03013 [Fimbriimonadaceae bacterium]|nr:hypothetical protein [Fimbriimonadaceae bacterium]
MGKFRWKLEKLLEYRRLQEDWSKTAFLEAQQRLVDGEAAIGRIRDRRARVLRQPLAGLEDRLTMQGYLVRLDNEEREQDVANGVLVNELESAKREWIDRRKETKALERLREAAESAWRSGILKQEQSELDEWAVMRRAA